MRRRTGLLTESLEPRLVLAPVSLLPRGLPAAPGGESGSGGEAPDNRDDARRESPARQQTATSVESTSQSESTTQTDESDSGSLSQREGPTVGSNSGTATAPESEPVRAEADSQIVQERVSEPIVQETVLEPVSVSSDDSRSEVSVSENSSESSTNRVEVTVDERSESNADGDSLSRDSIGDQSRDDDRSDSPNIDTGPIDNSSDRDTTDSPVLDRDQDTQPKADPVDDDSETNTDSKDDLIRIRKKLAVRHRKVADTDGEVVVSDVPDRILVAIDRGGVVVVARDDVSDTPTDGDTTREPQTATNETQSHDTDPQTTRGDGTEKEEQAIAERKEAIQHAVDTLRHDQAAPQNQAEPVIVTDRDERTLAQKPSTENDPAPVAPFEGEGWIVTLKRTVSSLFAPIGQPDIVDDASDAGVPAAAVAGAVSFLAIGRRGSADQNRQSPDALRDSFALLDRRWWRDRWRSLGGKRRQRSTPISDVDRDSNSNGESPLTEPAINEAFVLSTMQTIDASSFALSTLPTSANGEGGEQSGGSDSMVEVATGVAVAATIAAGTQASRSRSRNSTATARRTRPNRAMKYQGTTVAHPQGGFPVSPGIG